MCAHRERPYAADADTTATSRSPLRLSEDAEDGVILLPLFPGMTDVDQARVIEALVDALPAHAAAGTGVSSSSSATAPARL